MKKVKCPFCALELNVVNEAEGIYYITRHVESQHPEKEEEYVERHWAKSTDGTMGIKVKGRKGKK